MADEFARFMSSDQSEVLIRTHVIDVFNPARSELAQRVFWRSVAQHGRGEPRNAQAALLLALCW
jgi:hypothetical protein